MAFRLLFFLFLTPLCLIAQNTQVCQCPVTTSFIQPSCFGACNGNATACVQTSCAINYMPYTFNWSNGQSGSGSSNNGVTCFTATGLCAGTYTVTVTDNNGGTCTQTVVVTQPAPFSISVNTTPSSNCSTCTGTATLSTTGGSGSQSYSWSNGGFGSIATGLCAGTSYTVTATDANNCQATASFTIISSSVPTTTIQSIQNVHCFGESSGYATCVTSGGCTPYTHSWSSGSITQGAFSLSAGIYTVTVTDCSGCTSTATCVIGQPPMLMVASSVINDASCGSCADGTASSTGSGGTPAYNYSWSNGQTTQSATGLSPGTYTVCITDANLCTACTTITVLNAVGVDETEGALLSIWPNPFSTTLTLSGNLNINEIVLFSQLGEVVFRKKVEGNSAQPITVQPDLPFGTYLLQVKANGSEINKRVTKIE